MRAAAMNRHQSIPVGMILIYLFMMVWPLAVMGSIAMPIVSTLREILEIGVRQVDAGEYQSALVISSTTVFLAGLLFLAFLRFYRKTIRRFLRPDFSRFAAPKEEPAETVANGEVLETQTA
jgi:hypothetical protein